MYFERELIKFSTFNIKKEALKQAVIARRKRKCIPSLAKSKFIKVGDILEIAFKRDCSLITFEGICLRISKQALCKPDVCFTIRMLFSM